MGDRNKILMLHFRKRYSRYSSERVKINIHRTKIFHSCFGIDINICIHIIAKHKIIEVSILDLEYCFDLGENDLRIIMVGENSKLDD